MRFLLQNIALLLALLATPRLAPAQTLPAEAALGTWLNQERDARIQIYTCGGLLCGKLVQITPPAGTDPRRVLDTMNPDPKLRARPLLGLELMRGFRFAGGRAWEGGTIYDARAGKTYACNMALQGRNQLAVRGYIGVAFMGRTTTWTRVP